MPHNPLTPQHVPLVDEIEPLPGGAGDFQVLGRATLQTVGDEIVVDRFPVRQFLRILVRARASGTINVQLRFNGDSGSNYSRRSSRDGGAEDTAVNQSAITISVPGVAAAQNLFSVVWVNNIPDATKQVIAETTRGTQSAGGSPARVEVRGKWANSTESITSVTVVNSDTGDFAVGSAVTVLGHD